MMVLFPEFATMDIASLARDAELLAVAGIHSAMELCKHEAPELAAKLELANIHLGYRYELPTERELAMWIRESRLRLFGWSRN